MKLSKAQRPVLFGWSVNTLIENEYFIGRMTDGELGAFKDNNTYVIYQDLKYWHLKPRGCKRGTKSVKLLKNKEEYEACVAQRIAEKIL